MKSFRFLQSSISMVKKQLKDVLDIHKIQWNISYNACDGHEKAKLGMGAAASYWNFWNRRHKQVFTQLQDKFAVLII